MEDDKQFDKTIDHQANETPADARQPANWARRGVVAALALGAVAVTGAAVAQGGWGPGGWGHGWGHGHRFGMGMGGHPFERMLEEIDATAEQETKIWEIVDGVRGEVRPVMREFRNTHEQLATLLAAPTIDRAAVEKLRAERIAAVDQASQKLTTALVSAAEVLTPEQRAKLAEHVEKHRAGRW
jgi:Spy/CpxP family protein refolding chaperone